MNALLGEARTGVGGFQGFLDAAGPAAAKKEARAAQDSTGACQEQPKSELSKPLLTILDSVRVGEYTEGARSNCQDAQAEGK